MISKNSFVNRHGHKTDVDNAVEQIAEQEQTVIEPTVTVKKKPTESRRTFPKIHISKKAADILLLIAATVAGVILVLGWLAANDYESKSSAIRSAASSAGASIPASEKSVIENIQSQKAKLSTVTSCKGIVPDIFSLLIPGAASKKLACNAAVANNERLKNNLVSLEELSGFLLSQQTILEPVLKEQSANEFASIPDMTVSWQTTRDKLGSVPVSKSVSQFKDTLLFRVDAVVAAWKQLQAANEAKDETAFKLAETNLATVYELLRLSASDADDMVNKLQTEINGAYKELT